jgi:hypothetical protein
MTTLFKQMWMSFLHSKYAEQIATAATSFNQLDGVVSAYPH